MNNTHLSRRIDNAKREFESIIDELITEVEELESDKDKMQDEIETLMNEYRTMNTTEEKPVRALDTPANHSLQDCLQELKAGRKAEQQKFLDECIARLNQDKGQLYVDMIKHLNTIESDVDIARFTVSNLGNTSSSIRKLRELIEKM